MRDENGHSKGFAFLSFENSDEAEEVKDICLYH
jgi:RNA recognition motif-containing protein